MKTFYYTPFFTQVRNSLAEKCIETIKKGKKAIYILPSREAVFDVRKKFINLCGSLTDVSVYLFNDMEREIFGTKPVRADISILIVRNILHKSEEGFFDEVKEKPGFIRSLYSFIKRLKRLNISPEKFNSIKDNFNGLLLKKCIFIQHIYKEYEDYKEKEGLYDIDDISIQAFGKVKYSSLLRQTGIIVIDGYINIDPVNKSLLKNICNNYPDIDLYASIPFKNPNNEEFINNEIIKDLTDLGFIYNKSEFVPEEANPSIKILCNNLYSDDQVLKREIKGIKILNSPCIDHEIREAGRIIKKKIISRETLPENIAIYVKNIDEYSSAFEEIFEETGIPGRFTWKKSLITVPLVKDISGLFNLYIEGREEEGIKNIFSSIYLLNFKILKKINFETERITVPLGRAFKGKKPEEYLNILLSVINKDETFGEIEGDLSLFINLLLSFNPSLFSKKEECLQKLKYIINNIDLKGNIISLYREGITDAKNFARDIKAFESLEKLLEGMIEMEKKYGLPSESVNFETFYEELLLCLSGTEMANDKKDTGGVAVLNPDLARGQYYHSVFLLGVNEGIFPAVSSGNPLFDTGENDIFMREGINLINRNWEIEREKIRFNLCMASAKEELYISYRTCDERGEYMIKSSFLDDMSSLMDETSLESSSAEKVYMRNRFTCQETSVSYKEDLRKVMHMIWKEKGEKIVSLSSPPITISERKETFDYINHAAMMEYRRKENPLFDCYDGILEKASSLENKYSFSPSQFNSYILCPFKYFIERILGISAYDDDEPDTRKIGTFYHEILKDYYTDNKSFNSYDEKRLENIFNSQFNSNLKELYDKTMPEKLYKFIKKELFATISEFLISDTNNLNYYSEKTGFTIKPYLLEHKFIMGDKNKMIRGIVDRVDLEIDGEDNLTGKFIIYDYKNSSIKGIRECVDGEDFQLPVYYMGIEEILKKDFTGKKPESMALLYYSIKDMKRNGIVRSDMKKNIFNRGGPNSTVGNKNMIILMDWVSEKISGLIENIRKGLFMLPYSCFYEAAEKFSCSYRTVCRYDRYRVLEKGVEKNV